MKQGAINIWFAINHGGFMTLFLDKPERDLINKKWIGKYKYINSRVYIDIQRLIEKTTFGWDNEPECITIST